MVKGGNTPNAVVLHKYPDAELAVRRLHLTVRRHNPAHLVRDMGEGDVGPDACGGHIYRSEYCIPAAALKNRRQAFLDVTHALH